MGPTGLVWVTEDRLVPRCRPERAVRRWLLPRSRDVERVGVPLSEDEQRILHEIEQQFYESDPAFARGVGKTTLYRHAGRNLKWATLGFLAGFVLLVVAFASSLFLGFVGFAVMLACAFVFERNLRKMGRSGCRRV